MHKILKILSGFTCIVTMIIVSSLPSCDDPFDYYNPPGDLPDPIYTQIKKEPGFSIFASGIEMVPELQNIIDASGLYTAFIPTDSAFQEYFNKKGINSLADLPAEELQQLINYHLVFDLRFVYDFWYEQAFDERNTYDPYQTRYLTRCDPVDYIVRDTKLDRDLIVIADNKYINVYVKDLLEHTASAGGNYLNDYKLVYGRDPVDVNINASMLVSDSSLFDLNAENGALHGIREVIEPPSRIDEIIAAGNNTQLFKQIVDKLTKLSPSGLVNSTGDSLYNITFGTDDHNASIASENNLYTVFLPPDNVLGDFLGIVEEGFGGSFDSVPNTTMTELFLNHISEGSHWDKEINEGIETIADPDKTINLKNMITGSQLASNGMVYFIDDILVPDKLSSVTGPLLLNKDFLIFSRGLDKAGSLPNLSNLEDKSNVKTVLAVPNSAFEEAGIVYEVRRGRFKRDNKTMTSQELKHLFEYHVLRGEYSVSGLEDGYYETENYMWVLAINGEFFGNTPGNILKITDTYDWGENGYVHKVDKVLVPPDKSLKALLQSNEEYSSFTTALAQYQLLDQFGLLESDGTYHTFFVPPDDEVDKIVADTNFTVEDILMYHIVETYDRPLFTIGTENGSYETLLEDAEIEVEINGANMTINSDVQIVGTANVLGITGVIQQVDKVLSPPLPEK